MEKSIQTDLMSGQERLQVNPCLILTVLTLNLIKELRLQSQKNIKAAGTVSVSSMAEKPETDRCHQCMYL